MRVLLLAAFLVAGCRVDPPLPPADIPGTCEGWCSAIAAAPDKCGVDSAACLDDCRKTVAAEESIGRRFPLGCMTAEAKVSCEEVWKCR
jgi:hypothetical protein